MEKQKECFVIRNYPAFTGTWRVAYRGTVARSVTCSDGRHFSHIKVERAYQPFPFTPYFRVIAEDTDLFLHNGNDAFTMMKAEAECQRRNELRGRAIAPEPAASSESVVR